ncbi:MAG: phosphoribosylformylglycinamidine synthase, purS protein [Nitrosopumilus sp. H8]|nr:MAG: phosphoribosylformylglycinamidine synthase, purS protein [Nitrosopumilus sp. H13]RNJ79967.1 MAG: phosphoribosylformylglycinamidine synthase, purS protein [Nitrosopumilus sp. H8]
MPAFVVSVTIENKPGISDPEGDTILNDLVLQGAHEAVSCIRTAKMLRFTIEESDGDSALARVQKICDDLRIYNPLVSQVSIGVQAGSN